MSYIEDNLARDEVVLLVERLHWGLFVMPVIVFLLGLRFSDAWGGILIFVGVVWFLGNLLDFLTSEYGITNQRVLYKAGFIRRSTVEMMIDKVESVRINQSIAGRIFGYGTLTLTGTGGANKPLKFIRNPQKFARQLRERPPE